VRLNQTVTFAWIGWSAVSLLCMCISSPYASILKYLLIMCTGVILNFIFTKMRNNMVLNFMLLAWVIHGILILYLLYSPSSFKGSKRWILLAGISYQPSELFKVSFFVCFSRLMQKKQHLISVLLLFLTVSLLARQPDLGNIMIILMSTIILLIFHGRSWIILTGILVGTCMSSVYFIQNFPHARKRLVAFYTRDKNNKYTYQNLRSIVAIQNGGYFGVGPGNGTIKNTIPDAYSDFIFSVIGEEFGFIGCTIICLSYLVFFIRCVSIGSVADSCASIVLVALASLITVQSWIHMGTNVWLIPTKGTTLPCISHGGASFIVSQIALGTINNCIGMIRRRVVIS